MTFTGQCQWSPLFHLMGLLSCIWHMITPSILKNLFHLVSKLSLFIGSFFISGHSLSFFQGSFSFSDLYILEWSKAQFLEHLNLPASWAVVLNPICIESCGELLKDADSLDPLHSKWIRISRGKAQSGNLLSTPFAQMFLLQIPWCRCWELKS